MFFGTTILPGMGIALYNDLYFRYQIPKYNYCMSPKNSFLPIPKYVRIVQGLGQQEDENAFC